MERILFCLTLVLCALQSYSFAVGNEEYKRVLEALETLEEQERQARQLVDCKQAGNGCSGIIPCCGILQCYWEKGYSVLQNGKCVRCVKKGEKCQRDSQCCGKSQPPDWQSLQCDKGNALWVDGKCAPYRSSGSCYRDGQCNYGCEKSWWQTHGTCRSKPEESFK